MIISIGALVGFLAGAIKVPRESFELAGFSVEPGTRQTVEIPVSMMTDHTPVNLTVRVVHGHEPGPTIFVSAAIHGDEVIGVEIVRRLLRSGKLKRLSGTLLAVPIVNSFGFINRSRYLPDRRDLNRFFPGSEGGSLASRLADIFVQDIVKISDVGIDLHSAAIHRTNLAQIRIAPDNQNLLGLARAFAAPVTMISPARQGSLRKTANELGVDILLFEAGEALRFDETAIRAGVAGILRVMSHLGMINDKGLAPPKINQIESNAGRWVRAPAGGLLRSYKTVGDLVDASTVLGMIADPLGEFQVPLSPKGPGLIIGRSNLPLVNEGDALFHIAGIGSVDEAERTLDQINAYLDDTPLFDEDEII